MPFPQSPVRKDPFAIGRSAFSSYSLFDFILRVARFIPTLDLPGDAAMTAEVTLPVFLPFCFGDQKQHLSTSKFENLASRVTEFVKKTLRCRNCRFNKF
jgi:hypothetical protein